MESGLQGYWKKYKGPMEEQNKDRVNVKRTLQLLDTGAQTPSNPDRAAARGGLRCRSMQPA